MKVRDLIENLSRQNPDDEIVLRHLNTRPEVIMKKIRVYRFDRRVYVDGYHQERKTE